MRTLLLLKKKCKEKIVTGYKLGQFSVGYRIWKLKKQQKTTGARGRPKTPIHHEVGIPAFLSGFEAVNGYSISNAPV